MNDLYYITYDMIEYSTILCLEQQGLICSPVEHYYMVFGHLHILLQALQARFES